MEKDKQVEHAYQLYWDLTAKLSETFDPSCLAGVMMAQSLTIYKTILSPEDFEQLVDNIVQQKDKVQTIEGRVLQ